MLLWENPNCASIKSTSADLKKKKKKQHFQVSFSHQVLSDNEFIDQMFQGENVTDLGDGKIEHLWEFGYADRVFRKIELRTNKINNDTK